MIVHLRLQTPAERRAVLVDQADAAGVAAGLREELGFPPDWMDGDAYDCAVSHEPVHADYWRTLGEVQEELRRTRARAATLAENLRQADATIAELAGRP